MSGCAGAGQPWEEEEGRPAGPAAPQTRGARMDGWRGSKRPEKDGCFSATERVLFDLLMLFFPSFLFSKM